MKIEKKSDAVTELISKGISTDALKVEGNLAWLTKEMHPLFFTLNQAEIEALSMLTTSLHHMEYHSRVLLVDKPELAIIAQIDTQGSLYKTLQVMPERDISYAELTTSLSSLPSSKYHLEVLRFDYARKSGDEVLAQLVDCKVDDAIYEAVLKIMTKTFLDFQLAETRDLLKILFVNHPEYVRVSPPQRIARLLNLYANTKINDGIHFDIEKISTKDSADEYRVLLGMANPPVKGFLLQLLEVFNRLGISVWRSYSLTLNNGWHPYFLSTFYVHPRNGDSLQKGCDLFQELQREIYNTQILFSYSRSYLKLVETGLITGSDASLVDALIGFCHTNLAHNHPASYSLEGIRRAFHNHPDITIQIIDLFHKRFNPTQENRKKSYAQSLTTVTLAIDDFNSGRKFLDKFRRTIFRCAFSFIQHTLKTNFFVAEKHALSFRLDPLYLEGLGENFTDDLPADRPFRITYFYGRNGVAFHIGFSDIARGGWRTIITQGRDNYVTSANTMFKECYVLAHTQHLKNKDIYEGGSKMVAVLRADSKGDKESILQQLYKLQLAFINAFFDLFVTEDGKAKDPRVIDYYAEDEPIELGPDENMHDQMIEIIAKQSVKRGYLLGPGVMSSKQIGINHKDYGVTSIGVIRFAEVTMQSVGINMHQDEFSVKFTGGPNGDVAGNCMRLLLERCPHVRIKLIIDGSGALFDPEGLDHVALNKVILKSDLDVFDTSALHPSGFLLYRNHTKQDGMRTLYKNTIMTKSGLKERWVSNDKFYKIFNSLLFTVSADLFIPAGGRPETIDIENVDNYFDKEGMPSAKLIVEGANSFITPEARLELQRREVIIIRDASANKCGVISSSYEIIANLMLSDEEFLASKDDYVEDVINILNQMAEREALLILQRYQESNGTLSYTDISNNISREINDHYARIFEYFSENQELCDEPIYLNAMYLHMPHLIGANEFLRNRVQNLPDKVKYAILASKLASAIVYDGDTDSIYGGIIETQAKKFSQFL